VVRAITPLAQQSVHATFRPYKASFRESSHGVLYG
jgi:hypothetical protein